ncbi:MAG: hypothetical protein Q9162_001314 [Coniocarpon cinnabarinum]
MTIPADIAAAYDQGRVPNGTSLEYLAQSKDASCTVALWIVFALTTLVFIGRIWCRCYVKFDLGVDDALATISWACLVGFVVLSQLLIDMGSGRHYDYIQDVMPMSRVEQSEVLDFAAHLIYTTALFACRLSGLAFYEKRIISNATRFKWAIRITAGFLTAAYIPQMMLIVFHCTPVTGLWPYDWQSTPRQYSCLAWGVVYSVNSTISLASDVALFAIPIVILYSLQCLSYSKRVKLAFVIMPGIGVVGISIARLVLVIRSQWSPDESWIYGPMLAVETSEIGSTLIALSAPAVYPLFRAWRRSLHETYTSFTSSHRTSRTSRNNSYQLTPGLEAHARASARTKDPLVHPQAWLKATDDAPQLFDFLPWGPFSSVEAANQVLTIWAEDETKFLFAVYVKSGVLDRSGEPVEASTDGNGCLAGTIGLLNSVHSDATTEVGHVTVLPRWQRTCVMTHANGLLLRELLDPLPPLGTGLGLRRVQWQCHSDNTASRRAAERLGYVYEGTIRWCRVLPQGKSGSAMDGEGRMYGVKHNGRHSCMLAICFDDWERGVRQRIDTMMSR